MRLKKHFFRIAVALIAFVFGIGVFGLGQLLQPAFLKEQPETADVATSAQTLVTEPEPSFAPPQTVNEPINDSEPAETSNQSEFDADGEYYIADGSPPWTEDFTGLSISTKDYSAPLEEYPFYAPIPPEGYLQTSARKHKFTRISIGQGQIAFETEAKSGVRYQFTGKLLKEPFYDEKTGATIMIEGRLFKLRNGKKVAESNVRLAIDESCSC